MARKRTYTVRTGDTAATIARQLGIDPQTLMRANTGVGNLRPGMVLKTPPQPPVYQPPISVPTPVPTPVYPLDKMGGVIAQGGGETPYPPTDSNVLFPPATRPIPAYTQPAEGGGVARGGGDGLETQYPPGFTGYEVVPMVQAAAAGVPDETWIALGYTMRGSAWIREPELESAGAQERYASWSGDKTIKELGEVKGRGAQYGMVKGTQEWSEPYYGVARYDAYGNLRSVAPYAGRDPRSRIGSFKAGKYAIHKIRQAWPGFGGASSTRQAKRRGAKYYKWWKEQQGIGTEEESPGAIGRGAQPFVPYGYGQQSRAATSQYIARPNYIGLINWRI